jgi:hypothetical protein
MNNWHTEYTAEYRRRELAEEMKQIRLEELAMQGNPYRPGRFQRMMQGLGAWLVAIGEDLQCRYQSPAADCTQSSRRSYAS